MLSRLYTVHTFTEKRHRPMTTVILSNVKHRLLTDDVNNLEFFSDNQKAVVNAKLKRQGYKAANIQYPDHGQKFIYCVNERGHRMVINLDGYDVGIMPGNIK